MKTLQVQRRRLSYWDPLSEIDMSPWRTLMSRAQRRPLLPNLRSLQLMTSTRKFFVQIMWITVLASPSLRSIEARYSGPKPEAAQISMQALSIVLDTVTKSSPLLERLSLIPGLVSDAIGVPITDEADGEERIMSFFTRKPLHQHFQTVQNLRLLTSNTTVLQPSALLVLSQLPHLECLDIQPQYQGHTPTGITPVDLPRDSFPQLHTFKVRMLREENLMNIWEMQAMVANLTCLELYFDLYSDEPPTPLTSVDWISEHFIPVVCSRSCRITNLAIDFDAAVVDCGDLITVGPELLEKIARLPLQALYLTGFVVQDQGFAPGAP